MLTLRTQRLTISIFTFDDTDFILRLLNEPAFINNIADKGVRNRQDARDYLANGPIASYAQHGLGLLRISLKENDNVIGMAGFLKRDYLQDTDLGYALLSEYNGCGYAFEACTALMEYANTNLKRKRVFAIVNNDNRASIKLLEKLGFNYDSLIAIPGETKEVGLYVSPC